MMKCQLLRHIVMFQLIIAATGCVKARDVASTGGSSDTKLMSLQMLSYDTSQARVLVQGHVVSSTVSQLDTLKFYTDSSCSQTLVGQGTESAFETNGITLTVSSVQTSSIYVTTALAQSCMYMARYTPSHAAPSAPIFVSTSPASPSRVSSAPAIFGIVTPLADQLKFYDDAGCTHMVGSGAATNFATIGIQLTLTPNQTSHLYARSFEAFGNGSACTSMADYQHVTTGPNPPGYTALSPVSPTNASTTPTITGTLPVNGTKISIFSDPACAILIGNGPSASFTGSGVSLTVQPNASTTLYAIDYDASNNPSVCTYFTTYTHDSIAPAAPSFTAATPPSPTRLTTYPKITGTASADTATVTFYSDSNCSVPIGSGPRSNFVGTGILAGVTGNAITSIYAKAFDQASNGSACTLLTSYLHNTIPPDPPVYGGTNPVSPNNISTTPLISGNVTPNVVGVEFFSDASCTVSIGSGTPADFMGAGVGLTVPANVTVTIYAQATDAEGNISTCTVMTNYAYSNLPAPAPNFTTTIPASPSRVSLRPYVIGSVPSTVAKVDIYDDNACTHRLVSGSRIAYNSIGLQAPVTANSITSFYGMSTDVYGNTSPCTYLTTYTHANKNLLNPVLTSVTPAPPNNQSDTPTLVGTTAPDPLSPLPVSQVGIFDSNGCINRLGIGTAAAFASTGIQVNVAANAVISLYAMAYDAAGNTSSCTYMTDYTYSTNKPGAPIFIATLPASPSHRQNATITGSTRFSADIEPIVTVSFYSDSSCTALLASGTPALFAGAGIAIQFPLNSTTTIYSLTTDLVGNSSACTYLTDFIEFQNGPQNLTTTQKLDGSVGLTWTPDTTSYPIPQYIVKRSLTSGGPYSTIAYAVNGNGFTDKSVTLNKTYYYVVAATNNTGVTDDSAEASITISVGAPGGANSLTATPSENQVTLLWSGFSSDMLFKVYRSTQTGGPYSLIASDIASQTYVDKNLTNGVAYYYVVRGVNPSGHSVQSNEASTVPLDVPPGPTGLTVTPLRSAAACAGQPGAQLMWSSPPYYNQFNILRGIRFGSEAGFQTVSGTNTYVDCSPNTNVSGGNTIHLNTYVVTGTWGLSQSPFSNEVSFSNLSGPGLTVNPGVNEVFLTWGAQVHAINYKLLRATQPGGPYTVLGAALAGTSYQDTAVVNGQSYFYVVSTHYGNGTYGYPSVEMGAIPGPAPSAPSNLLLGVSGGLPQLYWTAPAAYNSFAVYRAAALGGPYTFIGSAPTNGFTDYSPMAGMNYYKVTAMWGSLETAASNIVSFRSGVPTNFTVTAGASSLTVSYTAVAGANSYKIYRSFTAGGPYALLTTTALTNYVDSAVSAGNGYFYVATAGFPDGTTSQYSAEASGMLTGSNVPVGLTVTATSLASVSLAWAPVPGATKYNIYQATNVAGPYVLQGPVVVNNTIVVPLAPQTTYYFEVTSFVSGTESAKSLPVSGKTLAAPTAPNAFAGNNSVDIQWGAVPGAISYNVERSSDGVTFSAIATGVTGSTFTDTTAVNNNLYFYRIIAVFSSSSLASPMSSGVTPGVTPYVPNGLAVTDNTNGTDLTLAWSSVTGAISYNLYLATSSGGPYGAPALQTSSTSQNVVSGLTPGTTYYMVLTALNGSMESSPSAEIAVRTSVAGAAPTVIATGPTAVSISWSAIAGAVSYDVLRSDDGATFHPIAQAVAATSYVDNTAISGNAYMYEYLPYVAPTIPMGPSQPSAIVTPGIAPLVPVNLAVTALTTTSVTLSWVASPNVVSYRIYRSAVSGGPYTLLTTPLVTSPTYTDTTVVAGNDYYYVVTSVNASGIDSPNSNQVGVRLSSTPTGLVATAGSNAVNLSWNAVGGATSYIVSRSLTSGGPYGQLAVRVTNSYQDTNIEDGTIYYYVVSAVFGSVRSPNSSEASLTAVQTMNLQIPIELTDQSLASATTSTTFDSTRTSLDTNWYNGTVSYALEIVARNTDSSPASVQLVSAGNTNVGSVAIPANTTNYRRLRAVVTPLAGADAYRLVLSGTASAGQLQVGSARLLVTQQNATRTRIYIPLLSSTAAPTNGDLAAPVESLTALSYASLTSATPYLRNVSALSTLAEYNPWELEVNVAATNGAAGAFALYNFSKSGVVVATETQFSNSSITKVNVPFDEGVTNFKAGTNDADTYEIAMICESGCSTGTVNLYKAGLWVTLDPVSQAEIFFRNSLGVAGISALSASDRERTLIDLSVFSNPVAYFQSVLNVPSFGNFDVYLVSDSTNDSGFASLSSVSGTTLNYSSTGKLMQRTGSSVSLNSGERFITQVNPTSGTATLNSSTIVIDVTH